LSRALIDGSAAEAGVLKCWWRIGHVESSNVGSGRNDCIDFVEDLVREGDVMPPSRSSSCSIVRGPMIALVTPGWAMAKAMAR
jgi:hypothetical protein